MVCDEAKLARHASKRSVLVRSVNAYHVHGNHELKTEAAIADVAVETFLLVSVVRHHVPLQPAIVAESAFADVAG